MSRDDAAQKNAAIAEPMLGAVLYLISAYQARPCPLIARKVCQHFQLLASLPAFGEEFRRLCAKLQRTWAARTHPAATGPHGPAWAGVPADPSDARPSTASHSSGLEPLAGDSAVRAPVTAGVRRILH